MINNAITTHAQWRRFLLDAGCKGTFGASSERAGCGVESDIFNSIRFFFASHKNIETCFAIHHVLISDLETASTELILISEFSMLALRFQFSN
jgi:hypothetical protein